MTDLVYFSSVSGNTHRFIEKLGRPALRIPLHASDDPLLVDEPFVLVAEDLSPADTSTLDLNKTLAIVTSQGGPTSHTAILARARGIVAVVSAAGADDLKNGETVIVNAAESTITTEPSDMPIAASDSARARCASNQRVTIVITPNEVMPPIVTGRIMPSTSAFSHSLSDSPMVMLAIA